MRTDLYVGCTVRVDPYDSHAIWDGAVGTIVATASSSRWVVRFDGGVTRTFAGAELVAM